MTNGRHDREADPDALTAAERALNRAAWKVDILKGAVSYYQALREYGIPELIEAIEEAGVSDARPPGVSTQAWRIAAGNEISPAKVFAYPDLLAANPRFIGYYRRLAGASTKAVRNVIGDPKDYETGKRTALRAELARSYAELFNEAVSALLEAEPSFSESDIPALLGATSGSQIQGSIVTTKGQLAQEMVWCWILQYLSAGDHIGELAPRSGSLPTVNVSEPEHVGQVSAEIRTCTLRNGLILAFSNEPDIAIREAAGQLLAVHEVKAGIDLAGAKERYPAAQRSFQAAREENPACHTVFVVGCLSATVKKSIRTGGWVNSWYLLPELEMTAERKNEYLEREIRPYAVR